MVEKIVVEVTLDGLGQTEQDRWVRALLDVLQKQALFEGRLIFGKHRIIELRDGGGGFEADIRDEDGVMLDALRYD